ncbi:MAG: NifU family protein [Candidatus Altiarchaeia archaeon]
MDTKEKVAKVIEKVRPALQQDGGDIKLLEVKGDIAKVRLQGACAGCPMAQMTLKNYVEAMIRKEVPEIKKVETG